MVTRVVPTLVFLQCIYNYSQQPAVGWNDEDFNTGVTKFGVANYEGTAKLKVKAPAERPALIPPPQTEAILEVEPMLQFM